jgi:curved DNA-binding protein CbpA
MSSALINPYELFGFDSKNPNITVKELKKQYFTLSLICHPDKGGTSEDMIILKNAYDYIKEQIENICQKDFKEVENEFQEFMKNQTTRLPPFSQIYEEAHLWLSDFNKRFEEEKQTQTQTQTHIQRQRQTQETDDADVDAVDADDDENDNCKYYNDDEDGYGSMMDSSIINDVDTLKNIDLFEPIKEFTEEIVVYKEPSSFSYTCNNYNFNKPKKSDGNSDYTTKMETTNIVLSDYKQAFTSSKCKSLEAEVVGNNNTDVMNNLEKLMAERNMMDNNMYYHTKIKNNEKDKIMTLFDNAKDKAKYK